jgi:ABC-type lipoprotein export system ATPase subunit
MTTAARPLLEAIGAGRVYGEGALAVRVLHPSDVAILPGEVVVLAGPSGSGKTTLLSILGLVLLPTEGEVRLLGERVSTLPPDRLAVLRRRALGFVFQQFNLLAGLSAAENVELPLLLDGVPGAERRRRATLALERVDLAGHAHKKPRELSGGQQQRVAIARATVTSPRVILCDEPTASLDRDSGQLVLDLLSRLAADGERAVLVVTHDERVMRIGTRLVTLADGKISEPPTKGRAA